MITPDTHLPLFNLYDQLRKKGLLLGIEEYMLLIKALRKGMGLQDRAALERLCKTLWVKSVDEEKIFDYCFNKFIPPPEDEKKETSKPLKLSTVQPDIPSKAPSTPSTVDQPTFPSPARFTTPSMDTSTPPVNNPLETHLEAAHTQTIDYPMPPYHSPESKTGLLIAQAMQQTPPVDIEPLVYNLHSSDEYFPVTRRQMKQSWRYFRYPIRQGPPEELDTQATIKRAAEFGMLLEFVLVPRRVNRAEILLLLDYDGSMVPFHMFSHRLIETVKRGGRLGKEHIYYFHNCPDEYLYKDSALLEYESIDIIFNTYYPPHTGVLFFSDAGAARGRLNNDRVEMTEEFLKRLKERFRHIAWLNPMPSARWEGTTAEKLKPMVAMFDLNRRGLDNAINVLRGRTTNFSQHVKEDEHE